MSDKLVFVAAFVMPVEAQLARGLLEAEGIRAFLTGEQTANVFSGIQGIGGQIRLSVAEADSERAAEIIAPYLDHPTGDADAAPEDGAGLWLCPLCGDAVGEEMNYCPACKTPRSAARQSLAVTGVPLYNAASQEIQEEPVAKSGKITTDAPLEAEPSMLDGDIDVPDMETLVGNDLVRRAFRLSLFSLLLPILAPFAVWLFVRLAFYPGKISPRLMPQFYGTMAIGGCWLLFFCLILVAVFRLLL
jgi:Putative prokaryotic signal transducing protein